MKLSKGLWQTYKEIPNDAEIKSHQLMIRAGLINKVSSGLYNYLPMGYRSILKFQNIVREEMDKVGALETLMTIVTPGELWKESGRWDTMTSLMLTFKDKGNRDLCISPTNEESVTDIFRQVVRSYKQLPLTLYQINTKFRDEIRPRFGLMRGREFIMKDAYSFHNDKESLDKIYDEIFKAYEAIFKRIGLTFIAVEADAGDMGGLDSKTHEFQALADSGEDLIVYCEEENFAANIEKSETIRLNLDLNLTNIPMKEVLTKDLSSIEEVCNFLKIKEYNSLKSLVYKGIKEKEEKFFLVILYGDDSINEVKLKNLTGVDHLNLVTDLELENLGLVKGFIGPQIKTFDGTVIFDKAINKEAFYTVGANKIDYHVNNFSIKRDLIIEDYKFEDIRLSKLGDYSKSGKYKISFKRGIEIGHIFQLGTKYTKAMNASVLDKNGKAMFPLMGCYGLGVTRTIATVVEQLSDDVGIVWPKEIAPYDIYFALIGKSELIVNKANEIYDSLSSDFEVLLDDRKAGAGFKFKDSELLGLPITVVLGEKTYKASCEFEVIERKTREKHMVKEENLNSFLIDLLKRIK